MSLIRVPLASMPPDLSLRGREKFCPEFFSRVAQATTHLYELRGGPTHHGYLGLLCPQLLSPGAAVWAVVFEGMEAKRRDIRSAREDLIEVGQSLHLDLYADIVKQDAVAQKFARFFGMSRVGEHDGYYIYARMLK